jgi:SAM-dependent methyltransferase
MSISESVTPELPEPPDLSQHFGRMATDRHLKVGRALAEALAIGPGQSVLELGCGTGLLSSHLAQRVGMQGDVLGLDPSPYHIMVAHQRARPQLRFQVGSPDTLARFPDGSFDVVMAHDLVATWPDVEAVLRTLWRLLRPGGRLGLSAWDDAHPHPADVVARAVLAQPPFSAHPVSPEARRQVVLAEGLYAAATAAGCAQVQVSHEPEHVTHATADAAWAYLEASRWGEGLHHLPTKPADLREQARQAILRGLERLRTRHGWRHQGARLMLVATKPAADVQAPM